MKLWEYIMVAFLVSITLASITMDIRKLNTNIPYAECTLINKMDAYYLIKINGT